MELFDILPLQYCYIRHLHEEVRCQKLLLIKSQLWEFRQSHFYGPSDIIFFIDHYCVLSMMLGIKNMAFCFFFISKDIMGKVEIGNICCLIGFILKINSQTGQFQIKNLISDL